MEDRIKQCQFAADSGTIQGGEGNFANNEDIVDIKRIQKENHVREQERMKANQTHKRRTQRLCKMDKTETFEEMTEKYKEMQKKYRQICYDVRDAERENYKAKEEELDIVRGQDREINF